MAQADMKSGSRAKSTRTGSRVPIQTLSESLEDYLEAIYHIVADKQAARATDIGRRLKVRGSSVTGALRSLAERGLINYAPYDIITLTPEGAARAKKVAHRHEVLQDFLTGVLAVDEEDASEAACGMEHHVGRTVVRRLGCLAQFLTERSQADGGIWRDEFLAFCKRQETPDGSGAGVGKSRDEKKTSRRGRRKAKLFRIA